MRLVIFSEQGQLDRRNGGGNPGLRLPRLFCDFDGMREADSSTTETPDTASRTFVNALHYAESQPMPEYTNSSEGRVFAIREGAWGAAQPILMEPLGAHRHSIRKHGGLCSEVH